MEPGAVFMRSLSMPGDLLTEFHESLLTVDHKHLLSLKIPVSVRQCFTVFRIVTDQQHGHTLLFFFQ